MAGRVVREQHLWRVNPDSVGDDYDDYGGDLYSNDSSSYGPRGHAVISLENEPSYSPPPSRRRSMSVDYSAGMGAGYTPRTSYTPLSYQRPVQTSLYTPSYTGSTYESEDTAREPAVDYRNYKTSSPGIYTLAAGATPISGYSGTTSNRDLDLDSTPSSSVRFHSTYDYKTPSYDYKTPSYDYKTPTYDYKTPSYDYKTPTYDYKTPSYDYKTPTYDSSSPLTADKFYRQYYLGASPVSSSRTHTEVTNDVHKTLPSYGYSIPSSRYVSRYSRPSTRAASVARYTDIENEVEPPYTPSRYTTPHSYAYKTLSHPEGGTNDYTYVIGADDVSSLANIDKGLLKKKKVPTATLR